MGTCRAEAWPMQGKTRHMKKKINYQTKFLG